jgi:hypothetical protein
MILRPRAAQDYVRIIDIVVENPVCPKQTKDLISVFPCRLLLPIPDLLSRAEFSYDPTQIPNGTFNTAHALSKALPKGEEYYDDAIQAVPSR